MKTINNYRHKISSSLQKASGSAYLYLTKSLFKVIFIFLFSIYLPTQANSQSNDLDTLSRRVYKLITHFADNVAALKRAKAVIDTALKYDHYLLDYTKDTLVKLPLIVVNKQLNNTQYTLVISKIDIRPRYIQVEAFARIKTAKGKEIYFGSPDLKLSGSGGIVGDFRLGLLNDFAFDVAQDKARITLRQISQDRGCFIAFDCDGFKELVIDAQAELSRDWVLPVDNNGNPVKNGSVKTDFFTRVRDFNDWFVKISIPDFTLTDYDDVAISVKDAIIDMSDSYNDPDMVFPPHYFDEPDEGTDPHSLDQNQLLDLTQNPGGGTDDNNSGNQISISQDQNDTTDTDTNNETNQSWRGFYLREFKLTLPKEFAKRDSTERIAILARNLLIDTRGVSGAIEVENILPLEEGRMQKWAYSVDRVGVSFLRSKLYSFYIGGRVELPVAAEKQTLAYDGSYNIRQGNFSLTVSLVDALTFPVWQVATVSLSRGSYVNISVDDHKFRPFACLSGSMTINSQDDKGKSELEAPGIYFEELKLATYKPYISIKSLALSREVKLRGTPISITQIGIVSKGEFIGPFMGADVNLDKESDNGIQASLSVAVMGKIVEKEDKQRFVYDHLDIKDGSLGAKFPCFEFSGSITPFVSDLTYGKGFQATLHIAINLKGDSQQAPNDKKTFSFSLDAFGLFGNVDSYRYWAVDASADFSPGITLGGVTLTGFSGGAYKHMMMTANGGKPPKLGVTNSGNIYQPNEEVTLGLRAGVRMQFSGVKSLSGSAMLQFEFVQNGLQRIFTQGTVELQVPMDKVPGLNSVVSKIAKYAKPNIGDLVKSLRKADADDIKQDCNNTAEAVFTMDLNFEEKRYLATLDFTIAMYNGFLTGGGHSEILADFKNNKFHFFMGTFAAPLYLRAGIGQSEVSAEAYLMFGNDIPGFPPINPQVAQLLQISTSQRQADVNKNMEYVANGAGMLMGAGVHLQIDNCICIGLCIRTQANADVGFDAGFLKFPDAQRCGNGGGLGIHGWYNLARFYLAIGIEVGRYRRCKKNYHKWADLTLGVFLEGQFPNPVYLQGKVYINVCGFSFSSEYKKGDRCL